MSFATILAITMALGGGWGIFLWLPRRRPGNRYRRTLGRPYRDSRSSIEQFRRIMGGGL